MDTIKITDQDTLIAQNRADISQIAPINHISPENKVLQCC